MSELSDCHDEVRRLTKQNQRWQKTFQELGTILGTDDPTTAVEMVRITICAWRNARKDVSRLKKRIKRLEEAGDGLLELCEAEVNQHHLADQIDARCKSWLKAKEAKP